MACSVSQPPSQLTSYIPKRRTHFKLLRHPISSSIFPNRISFLNQNPSSLRFQSFQGHHLSSKTPLFSTQTRASLIGSVDLPENVVTLSFFDGKSIKFLSWVLFWACLSTVYLFASGNANAAIRASGFGLKFAAALRRLGWPDGLVVVVLATLPGIGLRGAIPVGYWLQLKPTLLIALAVLGNMIPVPFIILYLKKLATFLALKNPSASNVLESLFERAKEKARPVEGFQWLGLTLLVAVPIPGTGAWTGAIIASVLDMPFWSALSAIFSGVVLASLQVNLLMNLGLKYAILTGLVLFIVSTFMWNILGNFRKTPTSLN